MKAYLDNAATTKVFDSVLSIMNEVMKNDYGNPSSKHQMGFVAEQYVKNARDIISKELKAEPKEILFTSGGTESNNLALIGTALANQRAGKHIITTVFEHPSVYQPLTYLEELGFEISFIPVDLFGRVRKEELLKAVRKDTILVSIMYVNNEIGAVQDIADLAKSVKEINQDILFHVDAIQAFGKYKIYPKREGIDLLSVSAHKIHGPKGVGFLYIRDKLKMKPIIFGGGQQKGMRSGTENVPAIAGFGKAVSEIYHEQEVKREVLFQLKQQFINEICKLEGVSINGVPKEWRESAPHIVSVSFRNIRSEVLLHALEEREIFVSSGSACASNHSGISGSLKAIGLDKNLLDSTLRFSFSVFTTTEEIKYTIVILKELLPKLSKYTRF